MSLPLSHSTLFSDGHLNFILDKEEEEEEIHPPENLAMVSKGVYRSAFPKKKNFPFLKKLGLKSIL